MKLHFAFACAALSFATSAAAVPTVYTSEAAFDAAISGATTTLFGFAGTEFSGSSYTLGTVTFGADSLQSFNDAWGVSGGTVPYLASLFDVLTTTSSANALGLNLGSYFGSQTVSYASGGATGDVLVSGRNSPTFIGFIDNSPITATFTNTLEIDTISFTTGTGTDTGLIGPTTSTDTVPEPASWALLVGGFGLVGVAVRRRRPVALSA